MSAKAVGHGLLVVQLQLSKISRPDPGVRQLAPCGAPQSLRKSDLNPREEILLGAPERSPALRLDQANN